MMSAMNHMHVEGWHSNVRFQQLVIHKTLAFISHYALCSVSKRPISMILCMEYGTRSDDWCSIECNFIELFIEKDRHCIKLPASLWIWDEIETTISRSQQQERDKSHRGPSTPRSFQINKLCTKPSQLPTLTAFPLVWPKLLYLSLNKKKI